MARSLLTCKWALQIVVELVDSPKRPSELRRAIEGIEERVLFDRLRRLLDTGVLAKRGNNGYPRETFYYLVDPESFKPLRDWLSELTLPVERVVSIMSCRWTMDIMEELSEKRTPKEVKSALRGLPDKTLHVRLRELEELGLVSREVLPTRPVRVLYQLTETGMEILPLLKKLRGLILYTPRTRSQALSPVRGS